VLHSCLTYPRLRTRVYPKVSGLWVNNGINNNSNNNNNNNNNNKKHSLRGNKRGYGGKTYYTDSQNSNTTAPSGRDCTICSYRSRWPVRKFWIHPRTYFRKLVCQKMQPRNDRVRTPKLTHRTWHAPSKHSSGHGKNLFGFWIFFQKNSIFLIPQKWFKIKHFASCSKRFQSKYQTSCKMNSSFWWCICHGAQQSAKNVEPYVVR